MSTVIVFETHSWSEDNDRGIATGWLPGRLSARGRLLAGELGKRRRDDGLAAVFTSDLRRAGETAEIAFKDTATPILYDWRLRECDYGTLNGHPAAEVHGERTAYLERAYPSGESWRQAITRVSGFLADVPSRWDGRRILVIGHVATRWALDHVIGGVPLPELLESGFAWQEGWEYQL